MFGSRTTKTLTALLATMSLGALILLVMETAPIAPVAEGLAALDTSSGQRRQVVHDTRVPVQPAKWRNIIIHAAGSDQTGLADQCHFIIRGVAAADGSNVTVTSLWKDQRPGRHTNVHGRDYDRDSIAICLIGDFSRKRPTQLQFDSLVRLARSLQQTCRITADHIYLRREVDFRSGRPGRHFPAKEFADSLLPTTR